MRPPQTEQSRYLVVGCDRFFGHQPSPGPRDALVDFNRVAGCAVRRDCPRSDGSDGEIARKNRDPRQPSAPAPIPKLFPGEEERPRSECGAAGYAELEDRVQVQGVARGSVTRN